MADIDIFGPIIVPPQIEEATIETLQTWAATYIAWIERVRSLAPRTLPIPVQFVSSDEAMDRLPEEHPNCVLVASTGLSAPPEKDGYGVYTSTWDLAIGFVGAGRNIYETRVVTQLVTAALRAALLQHRDLGGLANGIDWIDEHYDPLPTNKRRTLALGMSDFNVSIPDSSAIRGPSAPAPTDPPDDPYTTPGPPVTRTGGGVVIAPEPID